MPLDATLSCPSDPSLTGAYRISWAVAPGAPHPELARFSLHETAVGNVQHQAPARQVVYEGEQLATTVTGRPKGTYAYTLEVQGPDAPAREVARCEVVVSPPSIQLAFALFAVGLVVFVATLAVLVMGNKTRPEPEPVEQVET